MSRRVLAVGLHERKEFAGTMSILRTPIQVQVTGVNVLYYRNAYGITNPLSSDVFGGPLFSDLWRYDYCVVESVRGYSSIYIILYQGRKHYHRGFTWDWVRVIRYYSAGSYCYTVGHGPSYLVF